LIQCTSAWRGDACNKGRHQRAVRGKGGQDVTVPGEQLQETVELVEAHVLGDPIGQDRVRRADPSDGFVAFMGGAEQLGPAVGGVRSVFGETLVDEDVSDPLHALARDAHLSGDLGYCPRLIKHDAEDLPPCGGEPDWASQSFRVAEELAIQPEQRLRDPASQFLFWRHGLTVGSRISSLRFVS